MRKITAGTGLAFGRSSGSVNVELTDEVREELLNLRMHYIDAEQLLALHSWQAVNPGADPDVALLAEWRMDGMEKWSAEYPRLATLLPVTRTYYSTKEEALAVLARPAFSGWVLDLTDDLRWYLKPGREPVKVEYWLSPNYTHTSDAYLDEMPEGRDIFVGTDKHTDRRVVVRWTGDRYVQLS